MSPPAIQLPKYKHANPDDKYGDLTVLREGPKDAQRKRQVWCRCSCADTTEAAPMGSKLDANRGKDVLVRVSALVNGDTGSCGHARVVNLAKMRDRRKAKNSQ